MPQTNQRRPRRPSAAVGSKERNRHGARRRSENNYRSRPNNRPSKAKRGRNQYIDPSRFVKTAKPIEHRRYDARHVFDDFAIDDIIKRNLALLEYVHPTQIQDEALPVALTGKDVVGIANTGTGKTAAFLIPLLQRLIHNPSEKAIVLAPTRELALQIQQEARTLGRGTGVFDILLIGGVPMYRQFKELNRQPRIIIGTPGRIKDHIERRTLDLSSVSVAVLDEVDRMLDMGFVKDIRTILGGLREDRQSLFFSATLGRTIEDLIRTFTHSAVKIMVKTAETSDNVEQSVVKFAPGDDKLEMLHNILMEDKVEKTIVFCETKHKADRMSKQLNQRGFASDAIHGNKSQNQRQRALKKFRNDEVSILVATDVAARGIDVDGITHVINFELPQTYDDYTHRIGRTGRSGATGSAITFVPR